MESGIMNRKECTSRPCACLFRLSLSTKIDSWALGSVIHHLQTHVNNVAEDWLAHGPDVHHLRPLEMAVVEQFYCMYEGFGLSSKFTNHLVRVLKEEQKVSFIRLEALANAAAAWRGAG